MGDSARMLAGGDSKEVAMEKQSGEEMRGELGAGSGQAKSMIEGDVAGVQANMAAADFEAEDEGDWDHHGPEPTLEDAFEDMNLHGEEGEDLDLSGEVEDLIKEVWWLALFRVHTMRPCSHAALLNSMRNAWVCAQGVTFNIKGLNLFLAQCHCLGD